MHSFGIQLFALLSVLALPAILPVNITGHQILNRPKDTWDMRCTLHLYKQ